MDNVDRFHARAAFNMACYHVYRHCSLGLTARSILLTSGGKSLLDRESPNPAAFLRNRFSIEFEIRYRPRFPDPDISCHRCTLPRSISEFQCSMPHTPVHDKARQSITWVTYKQEYLRGSLSLSLSSRWFIVCTCIYIYIRVCIGAH